MLGRLPVGYRTIRVRKTGLPFFDANRLLGAAYYFFGSGTSTLIDNGSYWELSGPRLQRHETQRAWVRERLYDRGLERIETSTLKILDNLDEFDNEITAYFENGTMPTKARRESVSRYLEPALLQGSRGAESFSYSNLASACGTPQRELLPELVVSTLGLCFSGIGYAGDDQWLVLPVIGDAESSIALGPFYEFDVSYRHGAGGVTAAVGLALRMLRNLVNRVKVTDFAYAWFGGRGFYRSGYLGLGTAMQVWLEHGDSFLTDCEEVLWITRGRSEEQLLSFARDISAYIREPALFRLERLIRQKARLIGADEEIDVSVACRWCASLESIREVLIMTGAENDLQEVRGQGSSVSGDSHDVSLEQILPVKLAGIVAQALQSVAQKEGTQARSENGKSKWIGWYTRLENASKPAAFIEEIERLVSRAMFVNESLMRFVKKEELVQECQNLLRLVGSSASPEKFRAYRSAFLLTVLAQIRPERNRAKQPEDEEVTE